MGSSPRPSLRFLLLSHHSYAKLSHTLRVRVKGKTVFLCARCTGIGVGMAVGLLDGEYLANIISRFPIVIPVLVIPAIIDWLLQVYGIRESRNARRVVTGALIGQAYLVGMIALFRGWFTVLEYYGILFVSLAAVLYALFRTTGIMDEYLSKSWPLRPAD